MSGLSKFLFGAAVTGAAAYGVYSFLQKYRVEITPVDGKNDNTAEDSTEFAGEETPDPAKENTGNVGKTFDPAKFFDPEKASAAADTIRDAANRAYTTIQHGSHQAADAVRETVIPKGQEVVGKVKDTVVPKGQEVLEKVREAVQSRAEEGGETAAEAPDEPGDASVPDTDTVPAQEEETSVTVEKDDRGEAEESSVPADEAETTETYVSEEKDAADSAGKDETIEFFDDEG